MIPTNLDSFYFFFCSAVAKTSKTMLNSKGESGHPCLVPDFRGNTFNFSPLRIMFAVGLSYIAFYYVEVCSLYFCFLEGFYHKWMLNFVKGFLCIYWDNHIVVSSFISPPVLYFLQLVFYFPMSWKYATHSFMHILKYFVSTCGVGLALFSTGYIAVEKSKPDPCPYGKQRKEHVQGGGY